MATHDLSVMSRRDVLTFGVLAAAGLGVAGCASGNGSTPVTAAVATTGAAEALAEPSASTADGGLARLRAGNARFVAGSVRHPDQSLTHRGDLAAGQHPFALILSCVDSRVPPELVFDQGLGDLFVGRSAGQVLDDAVIGSIEYGVAELKIPLLVVLGHEKCGAVKATVEAVEKKSPPGGNDIDALVAAIRPAVEKAEHDKAPDVVDAAVRNNIADVVTKLRADSVIGPAVAAGLLQVVGARYGLATGVVEFV